MRKLHMKIKVKMLLFAVSFFVFVGCASTPSIRVITGPDVDPIVSEEFIRMERGISRKWKSRTEPSVIIYFCYDERFGHETDVTVISNWIQNKLEALFVDSGNYRVIDKSNLNRLIKEQKFQQSGLIDEKVMVDMGRQLGGNFMVNAKINKYEQLEMKVTNIETAEMVYTVNRDVFPPDLNDKKKR